MRMVLRLTNKYELKPDISELSVSYFQKFFDDLSRFKKIYDLLID